MKLDSVISILWMGKLRDAEVQCCFSGFQTVNGRTLSSSLELQLHSLPMVILPHAHSLLKVPLKYLFDYPFVNIDKGRSKLFTSLLNQVLHVKTLKHKKSLSAFQMTVDACCSEKERGCSSSVFQVRKQPADCSASYNWLLVQFSSLFCTPGIGIYIHT